MTWEIKHIMCGWEKELLDNGWEPFGISPHDTSYQFLNTSRNVHETQHQTTDYVYLRKWTESTPSSKQ